MPMLLHVLILLACNIALAFGLMIALWLVGLKTRDVTYVDAFWALNMVFIAIGTWLWTPEGDPLRKALLVGLCALWGVRLGGYLLWRWRSHGPDRRYQSMLGKAEAKQGKSFARASLTMVFMTQAPMLFIVCLPVQLGQIAGSPPVGVIAWIGAALALVGVAFESIGDWQLTRFRQNPANAGQVLDTGLWRYTRHPNYFGDACVWWGLWLIGAETLPGLFAIVGPVLLTWTLIKWSGVPTTETRMRKTRPDYEAYIRRTSGFLPMPPRKGLADETKG
jgi:steroid 5-alpha reductase family enzyme